MQTQWDVIMDQMVNVTTAVPWMLVDGEHSLCCSFLLC